MKKYISLFAVAAALSFTSCGDFLDVESEGKITNDKLSKMDQAAIDNIDGLYFKLAGDGDNMYGRTLFYEQAGANDIVWGRNRSWPQIATNAIEGNESPLKEIYKDLYIIQSRANSIIINLVQADDLSPIQKRSLGEAYFMRGFAHFLAAYRYGSDKQGVPFVRYEDYGSTFDYSTIPPQRATVMENYQLICEDMDKAIEYLPKFEEYTEADQGRAHKAAALGYKAKCLAYWACWDASKWAEVIKCVDELETTYGRDLAPEFDDNFSADFSKFWTKEYMFTIPGNGASNAGTEFVGVVLENKGWGKYNGWGYFKPTNDIYEEFLKDGGRDVNKRLKRSILAYGDEFTYFGESRTFYSTSDNDAGFMINKYMDPFSYGTAGMPDYDYVNSNGNWPTARINFPLMRFAEMLLFRAEAYLMTNQAGKATIDLNRLRQRSGLATISGTATTENLYHERRCELAFEFTDHLYDLKRWAHSGDAYLKTAALKELNTPPMVRFYENRDNPNSSYTLGKYIQTTTRSPYQSHMIAFPYSDEVLGESNGMYKQNPGYVTE